MEKLTVFNTNKSINKSMLLEFELMCLTVVMRSS